MSRNLIYFVALSETKKVKNSHKSMENKKRDDTAALTAEAHGVTAAYVRLIVTGKRKNEAILSTYNNIILLKENIVNGEDNTAKTE